MLSEELNLEINKLSSYSSSTIEFRVFCTNVIQTGNLNLKDLYGKTILMYAVHYRKEKLVKLLLEQGADPNITNSFKETALSIAKSYNHKNIIEMLENVNKRKSKENENIDKQVDENEDKSLEEILDEFNKYRKKLRKELS